MPAYGAVFDLEPPCQVTNHRAVPCTQEFNNKPEASPCIGVQNEQSPINLPDKAKKTGLATGVNHYKQLDTRPMQNKKPPVSQRTAS